ncbi:urease accessory protein UreF [Oceanicola granulosus HTCC2516]|uniref:Urease accessory protein UreF n=1 Tax=Oceanicola granulosus (strain ATCC BAA-861 / DSM 15982 / KCTC 12143 / HTCC2516) TaxID=314256 RepID=Q2CJ26_OCEGH|nr:urease accessory UreF family protein [Oceanicola granulosus]EAR52774.1 urease accessory protein UreF [Oceanicola granulosus HTCC2516]
MHTEVLTLAQWLSPAYPVGAFAYSHGLEAAIRNDWIASADDLQDWLATVLADGSGRNDCILLRASHACADAAGRAEVDAAGRAFAASAERLLESEAQGAAFARVTGAIWGGADEGLLYPVAVGAAAARLGLPATLTAAMALHANVGNLVSAAQRLMGLGQTRAQGIVAALTPLCERIAGETEGCTLDDLHGLAFLSDIAAMRHETLQPRIFRT